MFLTRTDTYMRIDASREESVNFDDLVKNQKNDGFVKSSRCKAPKSDGRGNPAGCPISGGSAIRPYLPQRRSVWGQA
jgi:hypothetical protein